MSHYKPYPAYKDSGVEWIGRVPAHWQLMSLKRVASIRNGKDYKDVADVEGAYPVMGSGGEFARASSFMFDGESVLLGRKGTIDKPIYINGPFWTVDTMFYTDIAEDAFPKFVYYTALNIPFGLYSTNTALPSMTGEDLSSHQIAAPEFDEQRLIAKALDRETARIDALIAKKTEFIDLLARKRQALITHAVTKGLDPKAKMKDSGVEWIGEVPEHWSVVAIRRLTPVQRGASPRPIDDPKYFDDEGRFGWTRIEDVSSSNGVLQKTKQRLSQLGASLSVKLATGDLFLSIAATVGKPCISAIEVCIHDGFVYFPRLKLDPWWLFRIFECGTAFVGLGKLGTQLNLNTETVAAIKIPLPPPTEIHELLDFIRTRTASIDLLTEKTQLSIDLLKKRRSALITAAVTGQIDLRESI